MHTMINANGNRNNNRNRNNAINLNVHRARGVAQQRRLAMAAVRRLRAAGLIVSVTDPQMCGFEVHRDGSRPLWIGFAVGGDLAAARFEFLGEEFSLENICRCLEGTYKGDKGGALITDPDGVHGPIRVCRAYADNPTRTVDETYWSLGAAKEAAKEIWQREKGGIWNDEAWKQWQYFQNL